MVAAWVWWCAVCALCACGARGAAVDAEVGVALNETSARGQLPKSEAVLLVAGGDTKKYGEGSYVDLLYLDRKQGIVGPSMPSPRTNAGLALLDGKVYLVGGLNHREDGSDIYVYDVATNTWATGPPLIVKRFNHGVGVIGSTIYAVGGETYNWVDSAEALDAGATAWRPIAHISKNYVWPDVAVLDDQLYVVGSFNCRLEVERYDPVADAWRALLRKSVERCRGYRVGTVDGALYVVGGYAKDYRYTTSVLRYRPSKNGSGEWSEAPPMHTARWAPAVATHDGKLYVVAGSDMDSHDLTTIEVFDPATDTWTLLNTTLHRGRTGASAIVVNRIIQ